MGRNSITSCHPGVKYTHAVVCLLFKYYLSLCFNSLPAFPSGPQLKLVFSIYLFPKSNCSRNNSRELVCICVANELIFIWWGGGGSDSMPFQKERLQISSAFIPIMSNSSGTKKDGSFSFWLFFFPPPSLPCTFLFQAKDTQDR